MVKKSTFCWYQSQNNPDFIKTVQKLLNTMVHTYNPSYTGGRDWEVPGHPGQKVLESSSQPIPGYDGAYVSSQLCRKCK
jgi:hypothetical protein